MKVICSGMPKTGTKSLSAALRVLGYTVYDLEEQFWYRGAELTKLMMEGCSIKEIREIYEDADAVTDIPSNAFWEEILQAFPDSKIIHTERVDEDEWYASYLRQTQEIRKNWFLWLLISFTRSGRAMKAYFDNANRIALSCPTSPGIVGDWKISSNLAKLRYRQHNTRVRQVAPKDRLLIFNVCEGWEPLCKFLGTPVPSQPFPHLNKKGEMVHELVDKSYMFKDVKRELVAVLSLFAAGLCALLYQLIA